MRTKKEINQLVNDLKRLKKGSARRMRDFLRQMQEDPKKVGKLQRNAGFEYDVTYSRLSKAINHLGWVLGKDLPLRIGYPKVYQQIMKYGFKTKR